VSYAQKVIELASDPATHGTAAALAWLGYRIEALHSRFRTHRRAVRARLVRLEAKAGLATLAAEGAA
jgi:hypothetical protein